ncbi:hypothetical protein COCCADRAFT_98806 [Bipolaris zeicola 26-R-13]|uniref:Uncharacterized protein n=1 Tax=Cochliobolus carbonum (strain 26-R-13) TaxID=930089 RepID=W6XY87_COCC2|nr:uncharacterized protein COCCADRAFT_98806 [Bipolaris zeicola 26-R-13]EUC32422.1 hypothetical protein COCCADRAFT_98806 [Bipolaris zeicola 26-R-13]
MLGLDKTSANKSDQRRLNTRTCTRGPSLPYLDIWWAAYGLRFWPAGCVAREPQVLRCIQHGQV